MVIILSVNLFTFTILHDNFLLKLIICSSDFFPEKNIIAGPPARFIHWEETNKWDKAEGLKKKDLEDFVSLAKQDFDFPSSNLSDQMGNTLLELSKNCGRKGLSSIVHGDLDEKTKMCGIVHCIKNADGTVDVSYAVKTLRTETLRTDVDVGIKSVPFAPDQQKSNLDSETSNFVKSIEELLKARAGVDLEG